jgi:acyl-CoA reductase-like NAD-dependent aldehyde dehydrogenase
VVACSAGRAYLITMAWDLRGALLKKEERESARLMDFAFRHRARTFRLLAERLDEDADALVRMTARSSDQALLEQLCERHPAADIGRQYAECSTAARAALIEEVGDPTPHRLL